MDFKRSIWWIIACLIILGLCLPALARAQNVVLKIGTIAPEGSAWAKAFREINKELEQKTNKQVTLRLFPGGILGDEEDMLRKIKVGEIQGALLTGGLPAQISCYLGIRLSIHSFIFTYSSIPIL